MKLSFKEKYSFGLGALGKDLVYGIVGTYLMFYFTDVIGLAPAFVGGLFVVARLWDTVNDPMMGVVVDNTRSKWGKFRPWILIGTIINAVVLVFLFRKPDLTGGALNAYYAVMYILWGMTYTIMDIPYWSMLPSLATDKAERDQISVIPRIFASVGAFIIAALGLTIVSKLGNGDQTKGFQYFALVIAVVFVITSLITCINVKEKTTVSSNTEKTNLKGAIKIFRENDQLIVFIGIILAFNLISQLTGGMALYYFKYVVGNENYYQIFAACAGVAEVGGLMLFPVLSKKFGRKNLFKYACSLPIIGLIALWILGITAPTVLVPQAIAGIVFKIGSGLLLASSTVMLADVVDYGEYKLGTRNESIVSSTQTLLVKCASAISGGVIGIGLSLCGYVANVEQTAATINAMRVLMIFIPMCAIVIIFALYSKYYKLNGEYQDKIMKELDERRVTA